MDKSTLIVFLLSLIALLGSFGFAVATNYQGYVLDLPLTVAVIGFFLGGIVFFGFFSFIPHIFYGLSLGSQKNAAIVIYVFPIALATYAGTKLGMSLFADFRLKKNFMEELSGVATLLIGAIILSLIIEFTLPAIITLFPADMWGLEVKNGKTVVDLIGDLSQFVRN